MEPQPIALTTWLHSPIVIYLSIKNTEIKTKETKNLGFITFLVPK